MSTRYNKKSLLCIEKISHFYCSLWHTNSNDDFLLIPSSNTVLIYQCVCCRYLVESKHVEVLQKLLRDPIIQQCRLRRDGDDDFLSSALPDKSATALKPGEFTTVIQVIQKLLHDSVIWQCRMRTDGDDANATSSCLLYFLTKRLSNKAFTVNNY